MNTRITKRDLKTLTEAGVECIIEDGDLLVVSLEDGQGHISYRRDDGLTYSDVDHERTEAQVKMACNLIPGLGGFCCQWGGWILRKGYVDPTAGYDYCDVSSPHHY